jgi:hypothetical protein
MGSGGPGVLHLELFSLQVILHLTSFPGGGGTVERIIEYRRGVESSTEFSRRGGRSVKTSRGGGNCIKFSRGEESCMEFSRGGKRS